MGAGRLEVLRGVGITIGRGEFVAIRGASGSGKSTLLHILGALDSPDKGEVFFNGNNIAEFGGRKINEFRGKKVGFVFQFYHLLDERCWKMYFWRKWHKVQPLAGLPAGFPQKNGQSSFLSGWGFRSG
jgi:ABC-type lipoprotein export system ATPase subunit